MGLMLLSSFFNDSHSRLVEVLAWFFPLILWWTVGRLFIEQISFSLSFIGFCSFLCHTTVSHILEFGT